MSQEKATDVVKRTPRRFASRRSGAENAERSGDPILPFHFRPFAFRSPLTLAQRDSLLLSDSRAHFSTVVVVVRLGRRFVAQAGRQAGRRAGRQAGERASRQAKKSGSRSLFLPSAAHSRSYISVPLSFTHKSCPFRTRRTSDRQVVRYRSLLSFFLSFVLSFFLRPPRSGNVAPGISSG